MASELETFEGATEAICTTLVNRIKQVQEVTDGWQFGVEAKYYHEVRVNEHGQVSVGVTPAQPFPISVQAEVDADRHVVDTTNLRFWGYVWGARGSQPVPPPDPVPVASGAAGAPVIPGGRHG